MSSWKISDINIRNIYGSEIIEFDNEENFATGFRVHKENIINILQILVEIFCLKLYIILLVIPSFISVFSRVSPNIFRKYRMIYIRKQLKTADMYHS